MSRCGRRGFTLVEILAAVVVLGLAATALLQVLRLAGRGPGRQAAHQSGSDRLAALPPATVAKALEAPGGAVPGAQGMTATLVAEDRQAALPDLRLGLVELAAGDGQEGGPRVLRLVRLAEAAR